MHWRKFKDLFKTEKITEAQFILGIDLGNATSAIAFFDAYRNQPEIIDLSGGYGKPTTPTVVQYMHETMEWVFGEYAILNKGMGKEITFDYIIEKLGKKHFIEIDNKAISISNILAYFIRDLVRNCKNLNPKAEIAGIVVSTPTYVTEEVKEELWLAFKISGYEKKVIEMVPETVCIFHNFFHLNEPKNENILLLDYGGRGLRGGIYKVQKYSDEILIKSASYMQSDEIGIHRIDETIIDTLEKCYADFQNIPQQSLKTQIKEQVASFAYQHKDLLFQKNINTKSIKLYFNFSYPPFQKVINKEFVDEMISPFENKIKEFLNNLYYLNEGSFRDINTVICCGGGFEMFFVRKIIQEKFNDKKIFFFKNSKCAAVEGASILAASQLSVVETLPIKLTDTLKLNYDIGFNVIKDKKTKFIPIVERNSFWQQNRFTRSLLINENVDDHYKIGLYKRDENGDLLLIYTLQLNGLPKRPKGTTRLNICLEYESINKICVKVADLGFGHLFPKTDFQQEYCYSIST